MTRIPLLPGVADPERTEKVSDLMQQAEAFARDDKPGRAIRLYARVTRIAPRYGMAYFKLGALLNKTGNRPAGLVALQRCADLMPEHAGVHTELGMALHALHRPEDARETLDRALALEPENLYARFAKAELLLRLNETEAALAAFDELVASAPQDDNIRAISQWLRGVARLTLGDYPAAWPDYESRIHHPHTTFPELVGEVWRGQPLAGRTIFLAYEQRFGDVIQFSRFVPELVRRGATVILQVPRQLTRLFRSLGTGVQLVEPDAPLPTYDYCQLVTSVPALLNYARDEVWSGTYLDTDPALPARLLAPRPGTSLKVGLVWAGKPVPDRSIPLECYLPLLRQREVSFYSFQLGPPARQMRELRVGWLLTDLAPHIEDFHDSSMLMKQMDLLITIDTAAAHQAGALGIPTWLMLIHYSDWRWGRYGNTETPWYPSIRIFRQTEHASWEGAARALQIAFAEWVRQRSGGD